MSRLGFITTDPPNAGTPLELLDGSPLDAADVYMRNNFPIPDEVPDRIDVSLAERSFELTLDDLSQLTQREIAMVLECAGNGRRFMDPVPDGTPWDMGGASPVVFGGVSLTDALGPISDSISEIVFTGFDSGEVEPDQRINYQFSLERAVWDRSMLVTSLGQEPLPREHGGPIRLVVPGHYAMKSVKWVTAIVGLAEPFTGHFVKKYRYYSDTHFDESAPVREIQVRSLIAHPGEGAVLPDGPTRISGSAWSGSSLITSVEISIDGGETWLATTFAIKPSMFAAAGWSTVVDLPRGGHRVMARASDSFGNQQPLRSRWNANGYGNNVVHAVEFSVG